MSVFNFNSGKNMSAFPQIQSDLTATNLNLHCDPRTVGPKGSVLDVKSKAGKIAVEDDICDLTVANLTVKGTLTANISGLPTATTYGQYLFYNSNSSNWEVGGEKIHIGNGAGENGQAVDTVALGPDAANTSQGQGAVAIGHDAANTAQGDKAIAIGDGAANNGGQGTEAIAIGKEAAVTAQGDKAIAIGSEAGKNQGANAIAIGANAGFNNQSQNTIAIGVRPALTIQAENAIAIGTAASTSQAENAIAIGANAGNTAQGANAIAIGESAGRTTSEANSLILNSSGGIVNSNGANAWHVATQGSTAGNDASILDAFATATPGTTVRTPTGVDAGFTQYLVYNPTTGEIKMCPLA